MHAVSKDRLREEPQLLPQLCGLCISQQKLAQGRSGTGVEAPGTHTDDGEIRGLSPPAKSYSFEGCTRGSHAPKHGAVRLLLPLLFDMKGALRNSGLYRHLISAVFSLRHQ